VTEAHVCEQLAQSCYLIVDLLGVESAASRICNLLTASNHYTIKLH